MRVCDYIASRLYDLGVRHVYGLMGGGAAGLNDGFIGHGLLKYICFHHEQGAAHAATGEAKLTGKLAVVNPTTGCGGTNCITGVLNAWQDGIPVLYISGNVRKDQCSRWINRQSNTNIRKYGIQEHDIVSTVASMTKYAVFVEDANSVPAVLDEAIRTATSGRPGPVWIDIPADVQVASISNVSVHEFNDTSSNELGSTDLETVKRMLAVLESAERPVVLAGQGIKQAGAAERFGKFIEAVGIPYVSTYGARDLLPYHHPLNIGAIGIKGSRAGNFVMQSADALLVLGCSTNTSHVGYDISSWTPLAKTRMLVDIDADEFKKGTIVWDLFANIDIADFIDAIMEIKNAR